MMLLPWRRRVEMLWHRFYVYPAPEPMPRSRLFWVATALTTVAVITFSIYFLALLLARHDAFLTNAEDLGIMDQALWNTVHGRFLHQTICNIVLDTNCASPTGLMRFAIHVEPVLLPISLLYLLWESPKVLLVVQTLVVACGAFPAFWLARLRLRNELAAVMIACLYLLYPAVHQAVVFDFHAVTLSSTFLLSFFYCMYTRRTAWMFVFALLAMGTKEQMPLVIGWLGLWSLLFQKRWSGLVLLGIGILWFWLVTAIIMPQASPTGRPLLSGRFDHLGSPSEFLFSVILHPLHFLQQYILEPGHLAYLSVLLTPALCLPLLAPWILVMALPSLAINLLSSNPSMYSGVFHYNAEIIPVLIFATIEALVVIRWSVRKILAWVELQLPRPEKKDRRVRYLVRMVHVIVLFALLGGTIWSTLATNYSFHGQLPYSRNFSWPRSTERAALTERFIQMIPSDASVSTQNKLVPHLSHRAFIYFFPYANTEADYLLLDIYSDTYPFNASQYMAEVQKVMLSGHYGVLAAQDGLLLLKRGLPALDISPYSPVKPGEGADPEQLLFNWPDSFCSSIYSKDQELKRSQQSFQVDFSTPAQEQIHLVGYTVNAPTSFNRNTDVVSVTTYWRLTEPIKTPLRLVLLVQDRTGKEHFVSSDFPLLSWCPSSNWQPGRIVRIQSSTLGLQWTKVPDGIAHMSMALLPLVQSSSTIMDVQARLPLHVVQAPGSVSTSNGSRALQLMTLDIRA